MNAFPLRTFDRPPPQPPSLIYLAGLNTAFGRMPQDAALNTMVRELTGSDIHHTAYPWHRLDPIRLGVLRARLLEKFRPNTVRRYLAALKGTLRAAWLEGYLTRDELDRLLNPLKSPRTDTTPAGRVLCREEIAKVMNYLAESTTYTGLRHHAMMGVFFETGLRRGEVLDLELRDFRKGFLEVRKAKGFKRRLVPIDRCEKLIRDWLWVRGNEPGILFYGAPGKRISEANISQTFHRIARRAGVPHFSPHDCRRTYVSLLLETGADIATVADLAGHDSLDTTRIYDRRPEKVRIEAVNRLLLPLVLGE